MRLLPSPGLEVKVLPAAYGSSFQDVSVHPKLRAAINRPRGKDLLLGVAKSPPWDVISLLKTSDS